MKKTFSWLLVLAVFLQLLTPMGVQAANEDYFIINTMEAAPGEPIQIRYYFRAINGESYTLYLKNTNGTVYKSWNLTCQPNSPYITGYHQFAAPSDAGQYEFQLYGRVTRKLRDEMEGTGIFGDIIMFVGELTADALETLSYIDLGGFIYAKMTDFASEILSDLGIGEDDAEPVMLFKSPPMEVKEYSARVWATISPWPGRQMNVNYENIPEKSSSFIGLYSLGVSDEYWTELQSTVNNTTGNVGFDMPMIPGTYQFRSVYFINGAYVRTGISSPFYVMPHNTVFKNIPDKINPGGQLNIQIENAPYGEHTWAGIYPLNSMRYDTYWGNLVPLSNSNSGVINSTAPVNPGLYCVRVFSQGSNTIYLSNSLPFEVAEGAAAPVNTGNVGQIHEVDRTVAAGHFEGQISPLILQAQVGNRHVKLDWNSIADSRGLLGYNIYRSTSPGGQTELPLNASLIKGTLYTDTSVTANTTYYYTVRPVYEGVRSNEVSAVPKKWAGTMNLSVGTDQKPAADMQPAGSQTETEDSGTTTGTTPDTSDHQQGNGQWNGVWKIDMGMLTLVQSGSDVTGTFGEWEDNYQLNGTVNGNKLAGTIDYYGEPGRFEFVISQNGSISGWSRPDGYEDWEDSIEWAGVKLSDSFGSTGNAWGGTWYTDFGPMVLTQNSSGIIGVYRPYTDVPVFNIQGTASGNAFTGRIREREFTGEFRFNLESGGRSFTGQYRYTGEDEWTDWNGIKKK